MFLLSQFRRSLEAYAKDTSFYIISNQLSIHIPKWKNELLTELLNKLQANK
jgi:hypothetical protein